LALFGVGLLLAVPGAQAAPLQVAQGGQQIPPALPADVIQALTQAGCNTAQLTAAVKAAVTANPALAADIAAVATGQCPDNAADIAAAAASADPADAAAIVVAVITALPPSQQEGNAGAIVAAVEAVVPEASEQITTAITQLAFNPGQGTGGRENIGAPLVAAQTDPQASNH
jgi:hypothetical protein